MRRPLPNPRSCASLSLLDFTPHYLLPQGMESPPREEVFLGAFQFQPENTIQMFPLQVPGETTKGHLQNVPHVQLSPVPYSPERCIVMLAHLTHEETEETWSCCLGPRVAPKGSPLAPVSLPQEVSCCISFLDNKC